MIKMLFYNNKTLVLWFQNSLLLKYILFKNNLFAGNFSLKNNIEMSDSKLYGNISIEKNVYIQDSIISSKELLLKEGVKIYKSEINGNNIQIGRYTSLWGPNTFIFQKINPIKIGSFCSIARNVSFQEYNHNHNKLSSYYIGQNVFKEVWANENVSKGSIEVGNDVWIGANAIILSGTKIGNGCVVAANAVLNKTYPPFSIIAGSPAKVIAYRFDEDKIKSIEKMAWWNWDLDKIKENKELFE